MKVHDFAYQIAMHTIRLLEETQHYKIPDATRKQIGERILQDVDAILKQSQ